MRGQEKINPFNITAGKKLGGYFIKRHSEPEWFDAELSHRPGSQTGQRKIMTVFANKTGLRAWLVLVILAFIVLTARVFYLQFIQGSDLRAVAEGNRIRILDISPPRGVIYDRNNNLLVENVPSFSLVVIPVDLPKTKSERKEIIARLAQKFSQSEEELWQMLTKQPAYSYQPVIIKENLSFDEAIIARIESGNYPGVRLQVDSTRNYLLNQDIPSFSHLIGYLGKINEQDLQNYLAKGYLFNDSVGKTGLEAYYQDVLRGVNGKEQIEVNARGETKEILAFDQPRPGDNLVLSIDTELQKQAEISLTKVLKQYHKSRGVVVALDPNSGEVLALVSWPAFDANLFAKGIEQPDFEKLINDDNKPLFSRVISGEYPSGSTFKIVMSAAALQEGIISSNTSFHSVGGIAVDRWFFPDWKAGGHGWTNVNKALAESVNTFFFIIGGGYQDFEGLGVDRIRKYAEMFGLNRPLDIDLPNEASGFLPNKEWKESVKGERWYIGDTYNLSIGQGDILVTPLQVASWTAVIANGGTLYQPHLVKSIIDTKNDVIRAHQLKILNQDFIEPANIDIVKRGLRQAVLSGSAKYLYNLPITTGAKTGTAQWSNQKENHAWITTFAPYDNPEIVVTVLIEEGGEGSQVALPVVYDILNWWAQNRYFSASGLDS